MTIHASTSDYLFNFIGILLFYKKLSLKTIEKKYIRDTVANR